MCNCVRIDLYNPKDREPCGNFYYEKLTVRSDDFPRLQLVDARCYHFYFTDYKDGRLDVKTKRSAMWY